MVSLREFPQKRHHHCYCSRIYHLFIRRKQSTDRRTYRSIYRNYLWNHPRIRHQRINSSNSYGRSTPYLLGVFKLGAVIKFIPYPIIVGFTSGIAVTIFTTQIADIFGLNFGGEKVPGDFIGKWMMYFRHFDTVNWWNAIVSIVSVLIIALTPRFSKKIPGSLIAIIVVTIAVYLMKTYGGITCIDTIGDRLPFSHSCRMQ